MTKPVWIAIGAGLLAALPVAPAHATRVITIAPPAPEPAAADPAPPLDQQQQIIHTSTLFDFRLPPTFEQSLGADAPAAPSATLIPFDLALVPEISTWAMTIGGLLVAGLALRYRRRRARTAKPA